MNKNILVLFIILIFSTFLMADGVVIPNPNTMVKPIENPIKLENHFVDIEISEEIASIIIEEDFFNDSEHGFDVLYIFPIPKDTVITDFKIIDGINVLSGNVMEKSEAEEYFKLYSSMNKNPAIMKYLDENLMSIRIDGFKPFERRRLKVEYKTVMQYEGNYLKLVYPLKMDSILKDGISNLRIAGSVKSSREIYSVYSPTYPIQTYSENGSMEFVYEKANLDPNYDFTLLIGLGEREFEAFMTSHSSDGMSGFFSLDINPSINDSDNISKNIFMVLDRSGSMMGKKYEQALDAAEYVIRRLNSEDDFNLIFFNDYVNIIQNDGNDYDSLVERINTYQSGGGTNIYAALNVALDKLMAIDGEKYLVFLTDGLPTVGITSENLILRNSVSKSEMSKTKMFVFGVGYDVNTNILDVLAEETGGMAFYVDESENIESAIGNLYNRISDPILTDVNVEFISDSVYFGDILPSKNLTVYENQPLKIFGKFQGSGEFKVRITGYSGEKFFSEEYEFYMENGVNEYIPKLWASRQIKFLINNIKMNGETKEVVDEIIKLGTDYGIVTPYTSYLLYQNISDDADEKFKETMRSDKVSSPPGVSGQDAFASSKIMNLQSQTTNLQDMEEVYSESSNMTIVSGKVFFYDEEEDYWIDKDFDEDMPHKEIVSFGEEYFKLIAEYPQILEYLKLSDRLKIKLEDDYLIID